MEFSFRGLPPGGVPEGSLERQSKKFIETARACDSPAGILQAPRMDRRKGIALTLDEQQRFLEEPHTIILSTIDRHGYPHSVAMWHVSDGDGTGLPTRFAESQDAL